MSIAASAENTMKILEFNNINNNNNINNSKCENENKIFFKSKLNDSDDDDMVVIILEEDAENNEVEKTDSPEHGADNDSDANVGVNIDTDTHEQHQGQHQEQHQGKHQEQHREQQEKNANVSPPKQKHIGIEVYTHLQQTLESQKMYPLLPCNMISSFARVMEYVEYFDIPSEERKKLVVDLVKILAYSNNDYGSRDCFEYFVEHNMIDDIMKTIIDSTKNRYDINRFPHTNRKIVLSCVSISNKIKITKPIKIESIFEEFKINLCGLKRFFKMKEKEESKQT